jgi:hypothetical protein
MNPDRWRTGKHQSHPKRSALRGRRVLLGKRRRRPRTDRLASPRAPAPPIPPPPCGSPRASSPSSRGARPSGRSRASLQCADHSRDRLRPGVVANPNRYTVNLKLNCRRSPGPRRLGARWNTRRSGRRSFNRGYCCRCLDYRWDKQSSGARLSVRLRSYSGVSPPAEQLLRGKTMASRDRADRRRARHTLRDDSRLLFRAPNPPAARTREHLNPPNRLRDSAMLSNHSKSNGQPCRRLSDQSLTRKVGSKHRLRFINRSTSSSLSMGAAMW